MKRNQNKERSSRKNSDGNPEHQDAKNRDLSKTNNDRYEGYDEEKNSSSYQKDYDVDENDIDQRSNEYKNFDESTSKD